MPPPGTAPWRRWVKDTSVRAVIQGGGVSVGRAVSAGRSTVPPVPAETVPRQPGRESATFSLLRP